jgi:hypothetical protein
VCVCVCGCVFVNLVNLVRVCTCDDAPIGSTW